MGYYHTNLPFSRILSSLPKCNAKSNSLVFWLFWQVARHSYFQLELAKRTWTNRKQFFHFIYFEFRSPAIIDRYRYKYADTVFLSSKLDQFKSLHPSAFPDCQNLKITSLNVKCRFNRLLEPDFYWSQSIKRVGTFEELKNQTLWFATSHLVLPVQIAYLVSALTFLESTSHVIARVIWPW